MFESLASCFAFRCSAPLNRTAVAREPNTWFLEFEVSFELGCWILNFASVAVSTFDEKNHKGLAMVGCDT
jgi:hypothetical protein